jgi:hypothetical protein
MANTQRLTCQPQSTQGLFAKFCQARHSLFAIFEAVGAFPSDPHAPILAQTPVTTSKPFVGETIQTFHTQRFGKDNLELNCSYFFYTLNGEKTSQHLQITLIQNFPGVILFDASANEQPGQLVTVLNLSQSSFVDDADFLRLKQLCEQILTESA